MKNIYQFKITLRNVKPMVWRRIQVSDDNTFYDLHCVIQDAFGWSDSHLHEFETINPKPSSIKRIGIPDDEMGHSEVLPCWEEDIKEWFNLTNNKAMNYVYDFGDNWVHHVVLEKILPYQKDGRYPICIDGKRACPPEDCGGPWGYEHVLAVAKDSSHEEYNDIMEWLGDDFDAEEFDIEQIVYADPKKRFIESGLAERFVVKDDLGEIRKRIRAIKKANIVGKIDWEMDYFKHPVKMRDEYGDIIEPLMLAIVHPESCFVIDSQIVSPNDDYLMEFLKRIVFSLENAPMFPKTIKVKKMDLYVFLLKSLAETGISIELVKKTLGVDYFRRASRDFFKKMQIKIK